MKLMLHLATTFGTGELTDALRHMGTSIMDMHNVPLGSIQRLLGHENRTTTEIYLHTIGNAERLAIDVYERVREKSYTQVTHQIKKDSAPDALSP